MGPKKLFIILILISLVLLPATPALAQEVTEDDIADQLMCQCSCDLVLSECHCEEPNGAVEMKAVISEKLAQGESKAEIMAFSVVQYGEQVLAPPSNQVTWLLPLAAILGGGVVVYIVLKKWGRRRLQPGRPVESHKQRQQRLLIEMARLDDDFEAGKIPEENYRRLRQAKRAKLIKLTKGAKKNR